MKEAEISSNPDKPEIIPPNTTTLRRIISCTMILFTVVMAGVYLSRPLFDPDFYWHLKTGQWIWQYKSLPYLDPFGVPPLPDPSPRNDFILTSYWLIQLIMYAFYSLAGMSGLIVFRWVAAGICLLICSAWVDLRNSKAIAVIATGTILLLEYYFIERPQFVSFICCGALLVILFRFFEQRAVASLWEMTAQLSLLMILWSNMHGGFLIGQAILIYCIIAEGIKFFHTSLMPLSAKSYRILVISALTALIASFINPNAINLIKYLPTIFDANNYANQGVLEELSIIEYFKLTKDNTNILLIVSMLLTVSALMLSKHRRNITWIGILLGCACMGCLHMRLMPFFIVSAILFMTKYFEAESSALTAKILLFCMVVTTTSFCVINEFPRVFEVKKTGWVPIYQLPVRSADFIMKNNIEGNVYTTLYWGGYMIWRVGPENKIFHDGRFLSIQRAWEYNNSTKYIVNQRPYWKGLLRRYDVRTVILPIYDDNGKLDLLTQSVADDNEWAMVFAAENEAVFVRKNKML